MPTRGYTGIHTRGRKRHGEIIMISTKKYLKLISSTDEEVEKIINSMSEQDAKELLSALIKFMNHQKNSSISEFFHEN